TPFHIPTITPLTPPQTHTQIHTTYNPNPSDLYIHGRLTSSTRPPIPTIKQNLRRLFPKEPSMGLRFIRHLHVSRMFWKAPRPRCPHLLRPIRYHGLMVRDPVEENGVWSKETDIVVKYNTNAAKVYRDRIQALAEGRAWSDPPVVKEDRLGKTAVSSKPPLAVGARNNSGGWDSLGHPLSFTEGLGKLSFIAASAAQSAASVVQAGTKELTTKVRDGGYDYKVNETVNVVTEKTTEIGQKTWGLMKGVMAFASQKVEEYAKENPTWKSDSWQRNETEGNGSYQEFGRSNGTSNPAPTSGLNGNSVGSSGRNFNSVNSGSWDDWDNDGYNKHSSTSTTAPSKGGDDWAGWDDAKDDDPYDSFYKSDGKTASHAGKSDGNWSGAGFL
ncbi:hypothetical protein M8C21_005980, partial [Ambrosia artemisiifolia]